MSVPGDSTWADPPRPLDWPPRSDRGQLEKIVSGALASAIDAHGPITRDNRASAIKRILGALEPYFVDDDVTPSRTKGWRAPRDWRESCPRCGKKGIITVQDRIDHYRIDHHIPPEVDGLPDSLTVRIQSALLRRHPVTLPPERARNYAELAAFVVQGGS